MTNALLKHLQEQLSSLSGKDVKITDGQRVHGGDINAAFIIVTSEGNFFVKTNKASLVDMFSKEYNGLKCLKENAVLKVPQPLLCGTFGNDAYLVMEFVQKQTFTKAAWKALGEGLALLHRQTGQGFGFYENNYIGSLSQANDMCDSWSEFYFTQRIMPLMQKAAVNNLCAANDVKAAERIGSKLSGIFPDEPPSLLHGDLWHGNVMACANKEAAIFDPAVYYGNRETDIAMTLLFGGFDQAFYNYYNEVFPLEHGWRERVSICQLYPLLVHLNLFGSSYYSQVKVILNQYR